MGVTLGTALEAVDGETPRLAEALVGLFGLVSLRRKNAGSEGCASVALQREHSRGVILSGLAGSH
jgi:hypothetical protein